MCIAVFVGVMAPAERAEATVCFGPAVPSVLTVLAPVATGVLGLPAYAGKQGKGSLALGGGPGSSMSLRGPMPGGVEMAGDVLGEWGRHGYRATSFIGYRTSGCDLKYITDFAASYSYRVVDQSASVVRMEVGVHGHIGGIGPVAGLSYDGRLTKSLWFGGRLRMLPDLTGLGAEGSEVLTRLRAEARLQWATRGKYHPFFALTGGNAFGGRGYSSQSLSPGVYVNGMLGLEFRSRGDW